jgi:hypothetical protein
MLAAHRGLIKNEPKPKPGVIDLSPKIEPGDEIVRLLNNQGCDELNVDGKSFWRDHRGAFSVPTKYVTHELLTVAGFYIAPLSLADAIQDVATAVTHVPAGRAHDALTAALGELFPDAE